MCLYFSKVKDMCLSFNKKKDYEAPTLGKNSKKDQITIKTNFDKFKNKKLIKGYHRLS